MRLNVLLSVLALALLSGCAGTFTLTAARPYYQSEANPAVSRDAMLGAAQRVLARDGWTNVHQRGDGFRLTAVQPPENGMRDSIVLEIKDQGEIRVWVRTQLRDDQGRWVSPTTLCDGYTFARERDLVARITRLAVREPLTAQR